MKITPLQIADPKKKKKGKEKEGRKSENKRNRENRFPLSPNFYYLKPSSSSEPPCICSGSIAIYHVAPSTIGHRQAPIPRVSDMAIDSIHRHFHPLQSSYSFSSHFQTLHPLSLRLLLSSPLPPLYASLCRRRSNYSHAAVASPCFAA